MDRIRNHRNLSTKKRFREVCFQPLKEIFLLATRSACVHTFLTTTQLSQKTIACENSRPSSLPARRLFSQSKKTSPSFLLRIFKLIIDHWYELNINTQERTQPAYLQYVPKKLVRQNIYIIIPNHIFLVRVGGISGRFGRAMFRILARRSWAKIPMARPNKPDMPRKLTKKVRLGIYYTDPNSAQTFC